MTWTSCVEWVQSRYHAVQVRWRHFWNGSASVPETIPETFALAVADTVADAPTISETAFVTAVVANPIKPKPAFVGAGDVAVEDYPRFGELGSTRWHFRGTILDRLDEYFVTIRRLRREDPDDYALFSKIGFAISADVFANPKRPDVWGRWPGAEIGGCMMPKTDADDLEHVLPSFMYFKRIVHPRRVQAFDGDVYAFSILYDNRDPLQHWAARWGKEGRALINCHIGVTPTGCVLLRELVSRTTEIHTGRCRRHGRRERILMTHTEWGIPWELSVLHEAHADEPISEFVTQLFETCAWTYWSSIAKILIRVEQDGLCANFGIDLARGPYFFADRQLEATTSTGRKKPIFHAVKQHARKLAEGRETTVREHYRGVRDFEWQGYKIHIVLPERAEILKQHELLDIHYDSDVLDNNSGFLPLPDAGRRIAGYLGK